MDHGPSVPFMELVGASLVAIGFLIALLSVCAGLVLLLSRIRWRIEAILGIDEDQRTTLERLP